jgi:hypothetical protein
MMDGFIRLPRTAATRAMSAELERLRHCARVPQLRIDRLG